MSRISITLSSFSFYFLFVSVRGGLTLREGTQLVKNVQKTGRLLALDIVEVNALLGSPTDARMTLEAARHIATAAAGYYAGGIPPLGTDKIPKPASQSR